MKIQTLFNTLSPIVAAMLFTGLSMAQEHKQVTLASSDNTLRTEVTANDSSQCNGFATPNNTLSYQVTEVPASLNLNPFYKKYIDAEGIPVVSSQNVRDEALVRARNIVIAMLSKRRDIANYLIAKNCKVMIIGQHEQVCDIPEYAHICNTPDTIAYWNRRARGFGGAPEDEFSCSCGEENLICLAGDRYEGENILIHEFAHLFHMVGIVGLDPGFNQELAALMKRAVEKGLWKNTYAMSADVEYFAEAVQSFLNCNRYSETANGVHGSINRREKLKTYDPDMYHLLQKYFPETEMPICNVAHP